MNEHIKARTAITVSVAEAKARFSELLGKAAAGDEIHVTRHGKPYAVIGPATPQRPKLPRVGAFEGQVWIAEDFDELGPE